MHSLDYTIQLCSQLSHWDDGVNALSCAAHIFIDFNCLITKDTRFKWVYLEICAQNYLFIIPVCTPEDKIHRAELITTLQYWLFLHCSPAISLQSEQQMAEESFDSGVSSEHSQYNQDVKPQQQQQQYPCLQRSKCQRESTYINPVHQQHSVNLLNGQYGPSIPQRSSCSQWQIDSAAYSQTRSHRNCPFSQSSFESASDFERSTSTNPTPSTPQKSPRSSEQVDYRYLGNANSKEMSFTNPFDQHDNSHGHGFPVSQSGSGNIRGSSPRVVRFAREQMRGGCRPALQSNLFATRPIDSMVRLEDMRVCTSGELETARLPYARDYSGRDYAYLPPMQTYSGRTHPLSLAHPVNLGDQQRVGEHGKRYTTDTDFSLYTGSCVQNQPTLERPYGIPSTTLSSSRQQANSILAALMTSQIRGTAPSLSSCTMGQSIPQGAAPSTSNIRRELLSARWSDSDMTAYGAHRLQQHQQLLIRQQQQQQQQQRQQQQIKLRQQQQQAAVAAAAAAAVAIAAIQGAPRSTSSTSMAQTEPISISGVANLVSGKHLSRRSCYSSGDEEVLCFDTQGPTKMFNQPRHQLISSQSVIPSSQSTTSNVKQQGADQTAKAPAFSVSADDYANYQALEALLGQLNLQPPPPAPTQPPIDAFSDKPPSFEESKLPGSGAVQPSHMPVGHFPQSQRPPPLPPPVPSSQAQTTPVRIGTLDNMDLRLSEGLTELRVEDRFSDFTTLPSERYFSAPLVSTSASSGPPLFPLCDWSSPTRTNPDVPGRYSSIRTSNVSGLIVIHLVAGNGLSSSQLPLRDLYCVIEMDSIRKARSMIRTSKSYFEWNEVFELDMEENHFLAFLLYQWDPRTKHRLCFYGGVDLRGLVQRLSKPNQKPSSLAPTSGHPMLLSPALSMLPTAFEKIALQLEPRGILYLEFGYYPLDRMFHRYQPTVSTSLQHVSISDDVLFGVPIDELVERERVVAQLLEIRVQHVSAEPQLHLPFFIRKCVEEIDRRGTTVVGIYRLTGSVWMKLQVRELFNRATKSTLRGIFRGDRNIIEGVIESIDLSPERVPDIHAITALFKDFLRELPEPLFTSALYPMFYDAMQVTLPGFSQNGAKLMLNILDCLPTTNQEILLYLLDHFKRVTNQCEVNRMDTANLATCLAPVLFYPAPNSARNLDPAILEPRKMAEIFKFILEIWPDERGDVTPFRGASDVWSGGTRYTSPPLIDEEIQLDPHVAMYSPHRGHRRRHAYHRASSGTRSTLSGPAATGVRLDSSAPMDRRSLVYVTGGHLGMERSVYADVERNVRVKFPSAPSPTGRFIDQHSGVHWGPSKQPSAARIPRSCQRRTICEPVVAPKQERHGVEHISRRTQLHPRFQELYTTSSTDSGTRWSLPGVGRYPPSTSGSTVPVKRDIYSEKPRSFSHDREMFTRSPRPTRRSQPYT